jgi:hypothetical protein
VGGPVSGLRSTPAGDHGCQRIGDVGGVTRQSQRHRCRNTSGGNHITVHDGPYRRNEVPAAGRERTDAGPERQHYVGFGQQPCGRRGAVHPDCAEGIGMSCYGVTSTVQVTDVVCLWYGTWRTDTVVALSSSATPAR